MAVIKGFPIFFGNFFYIHDSGADQKTLLSFDFYGIMYFTVDYDGRSII